MTGRWVILGILSAATCASAAVASARAQPAAPSTASRPPNIVLIVGDDMGYADIGVHGCHEIPTPNIDSFARDGVRCSSGYVTSPVCSPSRAGLLTGRYPQRFGHEFNPGPPMRPGVEFGLPLSEVTLADRLRAAGYATGMIGKSHLGEMPKFNPINRGFQEFFGFVGGAHYYLPGEVRGPRAHDPQYAIDRGGRPVEETEYLTDAFARESLLFIDRHKTSPFFLYLAFNAVHTPLEAPQKYQQRFPGLRDERRRTYAAMMSAMDDAVGAVLRKLADEGLERNTLVFFLNDNGGATNNGSSNAPLRGGKATTWEGGIRVAYFVRWTGRLRAGKVYDEPVAQIDILPTALAAAGVTLQHGPTVDGVNLLPFLTEVDSRPPHDALFWRFGEQMAVRRGDWKLVRGRDGAPATAQRAPKLTAARLFNLAEDVREEHDLAAREPDRVASLQAAWDRWNADLVPARWGSGGTFTHSKTADSGTVNE